MDYLLRLSEPDEYDATLQLFTGEEEFLAYLSDITAVAVESGMGPLVSGMWSWDEKDQRHEMEIADADERVHPDGWADYHYKVVRKDGQGEALSFTALIHERKKDS